MDWYSKIKYHFYDNKGIINSYQLKKYINLTRLRGRLWNNSKMEIWYDFIDICKDAMNVSLWKEFCTYIIPNKRNFINFYTMMLFSKHSCPIFRKISFSTYIRINHTYISLKASTSRIGEMNMKYIEHKEHI